ncbi:MAG TPA: SCO family protein [Mariprofundaceae bacterium]|nr:SCO family protein [Mariprofundaceae bacterium]
MNNIRIRSMFVATAILLAAAITIWLAMVQKPAVPQALQGMGGDFQLQSSRGPVSLHDFRGKVTLIYFGYTHCPDICPMALGIMAEAMRQLGEPKADKVAGLFISVDPRRDTPGILDQYASFFDKRIRGVTGTPQQLDKIAAAWRVDYSVPDKPANANYSVEHSTFIYLVNPDGKIADLFDESTDPALIADKMRLWLM